MMAKGSGIFGGKCPSISRNPPPPKIPGPITPHLAERQFLEFGPGGFDGDLAIRKALDRIDAGQRVIDRK